jgi:tetratricopeptide (TPR) repeat protein
MRPRATSHKVIVIAALAVISLTVLLALSNPFRTDKYLSEGYYQLGVDQELSQNWEKAKAMYHRSLDFDPNSFDASYHIGLMMVNQGKIDSARQMFEHSLGLDPLRFDSYAQLGALHFFHPAGDTAKAFQTAVKYLQKSIELQPGYVNSYDILVQLCLREQDVNMADLIAKHAIENNPTSPDALRLAGRFSSGVLLKDGVWGDGWTGSQAEYYIKVGSSKPETLFVSGTTGPRSASDTLTMTLKLKEKIIDMRRLPPRQGFSFGVHLAQSGERPEFVPLHIEVSPVFVPKNIGNGRDVRKLGVQIARLELLPSPVSEGM